MAHGEEGTFFYYLALLIGMALLGTYFWILMNTQTSAVSIIFNMILVLGGILFAASAFGFVSAKTRSSRVGLTMLTGILGGIHVYLLFTMLDLITGIILFALMAIGLLIAFAAFSWLHE
ncbi:MAG: hypothetical protein AM325_002455 [Candidatus Thorarchaeota archaeon SMTZ1-45]|nr:MAG: hypothetical protein AM325_04255 [Candidatus Thorarchaeota archaeon SMTZ1-45]